MGSFVSNPKDFKFPPTLPDEEFLIVGGCPKLVRPYFIGIAGSDKSVKLVHTMTVEELEKFALEILKITQIEYRKRFQKLMQ